MKHTQMARKAVAAGLGLAMALGSVAPSVALAESAGNTNVYVQGQADGITTPEGAADANIKVVLPVAISYVADTEGNLTGPADGAVGITNNTELGAVHVSKIRATPESPATLASTAAEADQDDEVYLTMTSGLGDAVSLADYQTEAAPTAGKWDVAQQGRLALNSLGGKIGGFDRLDPSTKSKVATIHWTVAPGTAAQAAAAEGRVLVHLVDGTNSLADVVTDATGSTGSLPAGYEWKTQAGAAVADMAAAVAAASGASEVTLYGTPTA